MNEKYIESFDYRIFKDRIFHNLRVISRTANGVVTTKAFEKKKDVFNPKVLDNPDSLVKLVAQNLNRAIDYLYEFRLLPFASSMEVDSFLRELFKRVNSGIILDDFYLRNIDKGHDRVAPLQLVEERYLIFCKTLMILSKLKTYDDKHLVKIFYKLMRDHYFVDGCGKLGLLLLSWYCAKHGKLFPLIEDKSLLEVNPTGEPYYQPSQPEYKLHYSSFESKFLNLFN